MKKITICCMKSDYNIFDIIKESYLTTFGYDAHSEETMYRFFESIGRQNKDSMVYILSETCYKPLNGEVHYISKADELYEIMPKLKNKTIIIDNLSMLESEKVDSSAPMVRNKMFRQISKDIREYAMNNNCCIVVGSMVYHTDFNGSVKLKGCSSIIYASENVFITSKGILDCQKCRYADPKNFCGMDVKKLYLRDLNLKKLLDD